MKTLSFLVEACFEFGQFFEWKHTVDIGTEKDVYLKNFTLGFYNSSVYIRLAYATNSSIYVVDEQANKCDHYRGRISTTVFNTTKKRVFTFNIMNLTYEDAGIYGLRSYYIKPVYPPMFEIKNRVLIQGK